MPTTSIDTFFACTLMVSVVIASIASLSGILGARISNIQDVNQDEYLRTLSENMLWGPGTPPNWGAINTEVPQTLGLDEQNSLFADEVDIDKICRLNYQNSFSLTYQEILGAARLQTVALGISVAQLLNITVALSSTIAMGDMTTYVFNVFVSQDGTPVESSLHCYAIARSFENETFSYTSSDGLGNVSMELPNAANGTALLVTFARASYDPRITGYDAHFFQHRSSEDQVGTPFLGLSPLDNILYLNQNSSNVSVEKSYAFSYENETNIASASNSTYIIPTFTEPSPIVLVVCGSSNSTFFIQSTSYPEIPLEAGADFRDAECHVFSYLVRIRGTFYRLTIAFGSISP